MRVIVEQVTRSDQSRKWPKIEELDTGEIPNVSTLTAPQIERLQIVVGDQIFTIADFGHGLEISAIGGITLSASDKPYTLRIGENGGTAGEFAQPPAESDEEKIDSGDPSPIWRASGYQLPEGKGGR